MLIVSSGDRSDCSVSPARARSGVIQITLNGGGRFGFHFSRFGFSRIHFKIGPIQTANVLPVPVAEWTSPLKPS
jgi:hypothetical protein